MKYEDLIGTIFDVQVSAFTNYMDTESKAIPLAGWLTSSDYLEEQNHIRTMQHKVDRDILKAKLPAITPSALLVNRKQGLTDTERLIKHTGFMQIDIDYKDNIHLSPEYYNNLIEVLSSIDNIAYVGQSISGTGYYGLVPITQPDKMNLHFVKFKELIFKHYNIVLDKTKGSKITDLRGYSYTPNAYFNINAKPFNKLYTPPAPCKRTYYTNTTSPSDLFELAVSLFNKKEQLKEGNRNNYLIKLAHYLNVKGIGLQEAISKAKRFVDKEYNEHKIETMIKHIYNNNTGNHNTRPFQIQH